MAHPALLSTVGLLPACIVGLTGSSFFSGMCSSGALVGGTGHEPQEPAHAVWRVMIMPSQHQGLDSGGSEQVVAVACRDNTHDRATRLRRVIPAATPHTRPSCSQCRKTAGSAAAAAEAKMLTKTLLATPFGSAAATPTATTCARPPHR